MGFHALFKRHKIWPGVLWSTLGPFAYNKYWLSG